MKKESNGLLWALAALALIIAGVGAVYLWQKQPEKPAPVFVDVGEVKAYAGGKRLVIASIVLEVANRKAEARIAERLGRTRAAIISSFNDYSDKRLATQEGKQALQQQIRDDLNDLFGKRAIRDVLLTSFVFSTY